MSSKNKKKNKNAAAKKTNINEREGASSSGNVNVDPPVAVIEEEILHDYSLPAFEYRPCVEDSLEYVPYSDESQLSDIQAMAERDLSEPYSIFTYRYFLLKWPELCFCAYLPDPCASNTNNSSSGKKMVGTIICKADPGDISEDGVQHYKGYIGMLIVDKSLRNRGIGLTLSMMAIEKLISAGCTEILLETEASNTSALRLYEKLGFVREELLPRYYLSSGDAFRLRLVVDPRYFKPNPSLPKLTAPVTTTTTTTAAVVENI